MRQKETQKRNIEHSIYKYNLNKQSVKVNITPSSKPANISQMNPPAYPNLTDINTTIKGTMQELF